LHSKTEFRSVETNPKVARRAATSAAGAVVIPVFGGVVSRVNARDEGKGNGESVSSESCAI
jgi:hypothetical protein